MKKNSVLSGKSCPNNRNIWISSWIRRNRGENLFNGTAG